MEMQNLIITDVFTKLGKMLVEGDTPNTHSVLAIRQGKVIDVTPGNPYKIRVAIGAGARLAELPDIVVLHPYVPEVNDSVWMLVLSSGSWIAIGATTRG